MPPLLYLINTLFDLYFLAVVIYLIISWLGFFNIINTRQQVVAMVSRSLGQIIEPVLAKIRKILPPMNGLDLSPVILLVGLSVVQYTINYYALRA